MSAGDFFWAALSIAEKDVRIEIRRPYEILSILTFSVGSVLVAGLALRGTRTVIPEITAAVLWIIIFFITILTCTTSFTREADRGTLGGLKTLPCPFGAVLAGKIIFGTVISVLVVSLLVPSSVLFLNPESMERAPLLLLFCCLAAAGLSCAGTFVSGLVMFSEGKTILLSLLLLPVCMPVMLLSVTASSKILRGSGCSDILPEVQLLFAFLFLILAVMTLTFSVIFEE